MRKVVFETPNLSPILLENFIDKDPGNHLLTEGTFEFSGVVLHRSARLERLHLEDEEGRAIGCEVKLGLPTPGICGMYKATSHSDKARYRFSGIPSQALSRKLCVRAEFDDGGSMTVVSFRAEEVISVLTDSDRLPTKLSSLRFLRLHGLDVGTVLDVGVQQETEELIQVFPDKKHILFEPIEEAYPDICRNYQGVDFELVKAAVSSDDGQAVLEVRRPPGARVFTSGVVEGATADTRTVEKIALDTYLRDRNYARPFLLKIDVDGHELKILEGAVRTLQWTSCVIIEAPIGQELFRRSRFLMDHGFLLWDIVDLGYYRDNLAHVDLIFLSKSERQRPDFCPWKNFGFDRTKRKRFLH